MKRNGACFLSIVLKNQPDLDRQVCMGTHIHTLFVLLLLSHEVEDTAIEILG